jgi:hypothetical protein
MWNGKTIDEITINPGNFNDNNGRSFSLSTDHLTATDNDSESNWCLTPKEDTYKLPGGDWGTPGIQNPGCL